MITAVRIHAGQDDSVTPVEVELIHGNNNGKIWLDTPSATGGNSQLQVARSSSSTNANVENEYIRALFLDVCNFSKSYGKPVKGPFFGDYLVSKSDGKDLSVGELGQVHNSNIKKASRENVECVLVRAGPYQYSYTHLATFNIDISAPEMQVGWQTSMPTVQFGVPLQVKTFPGSSSGVENEWIRPLFRRFDSLESFGRHSDTPILGDVVVTRRDRQPLETFQLDTVAPFLAFLADSAMELVSMLASGTPSLSYLERFAFDTDKARDFFETIRSRDITLGAGAAVESVKNPFPRRCACCKRTNGADGGELKRCGKCGFQSYCGSTCQKEDWKLHKMLFCRRTQGKR